MDHVIFHLHVSQRRACRVLAQPRSTHRYHYKVAYDETNLVECVTGLAAEYGTYGYRMITGMLRNAGWLVNHKRVARIWRQEGLKCR